MEGRKLLCCCILLLAVLTGVESQVLSGHVCSSVGVSYYNSRECRFRFLWCWHWVTVTRASYYTQYFCCAGWRTDSYGNCNIPICSPPCEHGGTCGYPATCTCPSTYSGYRCDNALCSYISPCYPGTCNPGSAYCQCDDGFKSEIPIVQQNYCLKIADTPSVNLTLTEMHVELSYWPRTNSTATHEAYMIMADSSAEGAGIMDIYWTNRRSFNRIETRCASQYIPPPNLSDPPNYVPRRGFGIVAGSIDVYLQKLAPNGQPGTVSSLNKTFPCMPGVNQDKPEPNIFNCSIIDKNFDRFLEHRDALKFTFKTTGGGFRELLNTDTHRTHRTQHYIGVDREKSVQFKFDFQDPKHCGESSNDGSGCPAGLTMLRVPDKTKNATIRMQWKGWQDEDSGMFRYAWEVFKMTKATANELEIHPDKVLQPLQPPTEVLERIYTDQFFTLPGPGMYSVILEAGDLANNTKYVRRLVFFDPDPVITTDPAHKLYVATASAAADFRYQNDTSLPVVIVWRDHFMNALHEDESMLGSVRQYYVELRDDFQLDNTKSFRKVIDPALPVEDHEGDRTVFAIPNKRAIVNFQIQYATDSNGGISQPAIPLGPWNDLDLATEYNYTLSPREGDTITFWVKATDFMGTEKVEKTRVSFDQSPPVIISNLTFHMNQLAQGVDFSSVFELDANDAQSGIAYILWTFTRASTNQVIYQEKAPGMQGTCTAQQIQTCHCVQTGECFPYRQTFAFSNCHMMVEKDSLANESIYITADVTNMAGLVTRINMTEDDLSKLNGTQAYYPPQNVTVVSRSSDSVTLTWTFPPSCFPRIALWLVVNGVKIPVHKDSQEYTVGDLNSDSQYTLYLVTSYEGDVQSDAAAVAFQTAPKLDDGLGAGGIAGVVIGLIVIALLVVIIMTFVLWRKGKIFQREGTAVNKQLHRMSRAINTVRRTVRRREGGDENGGTTGPFSNAVYNADEEIYLYGGMTFETRPAWQLSDRALVLTDSITEGRFANIYKANWRHDGREDVVVAKMLKAGFSADDAMKMTAKINFMATKLEDHEYVIKFLGAVMDNTQWGPVMVLQHYEKGQMDRWLVQSRGGMTDLKTDQVMEHLYQFTLGIAKGMNYLSSKQILHRRLAARNVLLNAALEPVVAGFGPQTKEGEDDSTVKSRVPAKWAAPEALQDKPQTEKSDVWSYGIVLWEIFSMGEVPYPGIRSNEIGARLKSGYRMTKPEFADDAHYELMKECWQYKQGKRPTFGTIQSRLSQMYNKQSQGPDLYYETNQLHSFD